MTAAYRWYWVKPVHPVDSNWVPGLNVGNFYIANDKMMHRSDLYVGAYLPRPDGQDES